MSCIRVGTAPLTRSVQTEPESTVQSEAAWPRAKAAWQFMHARKQPGPCRTQLKADRKRHHPTKRSSRLSNASVQWPGNCLREAQRLTDRVRQDTVRCNALLGACFFSILHLEHLLIFFFNFTNEALIFLECVHNWAGSN